jgi:putative ABC transport system permease protein
MHTTLQDLKYAVRSLLKTPGFAAVGILTIALGIGANTAIFTVVNALLIRPLPYAASDRLVMVWQDWTARGGPADEWGTPGNFVDWRAEQGLFKSVAAISGFRPTLTGNAEPESLTGEAVTHEYFSLLGVTPALGRDFTTADDVPNAARVAIISDALWKRRFGGDPSVVGRVVTLSAVPHEIIGVLAAGFRPVIVSDGEIWRPLRLNRATPNRGAVVLRVVARLADGISHEQAQVAATALARRLEAAHPKSNEKTGFNLQPLLDRVTGEIRPGLLAVLGGVGFVLLIACANIANLLLARGSGRGRELAVRAALGAGRARMIRQLLTESLVLAVAGGSTGFLIGIWMVDGLRAIAPDSAPRLAEIGLDASVFGFAALVTVVTGLLFGLAPALQHSRMDITHSLKEGGRGTAGGGGGNVRRALITAEVALALVLLTGGVLLIQTFVRLQRADLGFETEGLLVGFVNPPAATYNSREKYIALYDQLLEKLSAIPGVEQAALTSVLPLAVGDSDTSFVIEGRPAPATPSETPVTWYRQVSAGYFDTIGMPFRRGRAFAEREAAPSAVVNETFVRKYFPGEDAVGRRIRFGGPDSPWIAIVGVVADARVRGAREATRVETFVPYWQLGEGGITAVLKGSNPASFAAPLRQAVSSLDRNVPIIGVQPMSDIFSDSIAQPRFLALLAGGFAALALVLAAIGIYGVMAYAVSQRTAEIGVRMALGATAREVFRLVISDGLKLSAIGVALGVAGAVGVGYSLTKLLFGVTPTDPLTIAAAAATLVAVAALASFLPAWRATRVDPMVALRAE